MNSKTMMRLSFHAFSAVMYFCALVRYEYLPPMPHVRSHEHYAGRFKYLTYWNLIVQFLFFAAACIIDLMKTSTGGFYRVTRIRDKIYAGIVLPYGIFVVFMFWGLYAIDRELIFPKVLETIFPAWLNHVSVSKIFCSVVYSFLLNSLYILFPNQCARSEHTVILPVLLIETYVVKHRHPRRQEGLKYAAAFGLIYMIWILYLAIAMNIWVYPVLRILNWPQKVVFFVLSIMVQFFMYLMGEKINSLCHGVLCMKSLLHGIHQCDSPVPTTLYSSWNYELCYQHVILYLLCENFSLFTQDPVLVKLSSLRPNRYVAAL
ncbi:UNVERIFIED_CONTAM: Aig1 [Trichonephila clavipes]